MKLTILTVTAFSLALSVNISNAEQADVFLFLDPPSVKTTIDGITVNFRGELVDKDLTERDLIKRPRFSLSCKDNKSQVLQLYLPEDLNPWQKLDDAVMLKAEVKSAIGSFQPFTSNFRASLMNSSLVITIGLNGNAPAIGRTWYDGLPITVDVASNNSLPDLALTLHAAESSASFRTELASAIKTCKILSGS